MGHDYLELAEESEYADSGYRISGRHDSFPTPARTLFIEQTNSADALPQLHRQSVGILSEGKHLVTNQVALVDDLAFTAGGA